MPEIADYEIRRELLRAGKIAGVARLDSLAESWEYLPLSTAAMHHAAQLWATARQAGRPTADGTALDADAILAGQALELNERDVVIATTTNLGHLGQFVAAALWTDIK